MTSLSSGEKLGVALVKVARHGKSRLANFTFILVKLVAVVEDQSDILVQVVVRYILVRLELFGARLEVHRVFYVFVVFGELLFVDRRKERPSAVVSFQLV